MNYKIALKLKNANFPHNWCSEDDCSCLSTEGDKKHCFPTLSKLIDACKGRFSELYKNIDKDGWTVLSFPNEERKYLEVTGSTPEEAVSLLWLALNEKITL